MRKLKSLNDSYRLKFILYFSSNAMVDYFCYLEGIITKVWKGPN